jgi:2-oxoglutarate ferredoxin oxidoreductase subunit alpha
VHFDELWPFPQQAAKLLLKDKPNTVVVENNATGQLAKLIAAYTGYNEMKRILRYDGRPFMVDELVEQIKGSE